MPHAEDVEAAFAFFDEWFLPKQFAVLLGVSVLSCATLADPIASIAFS